MNSLTRSALLLATLAGAAHAQTQILFSEYQFNAPQIKAMGLDGSNPHLLFAPSTAQWLPLGMSFRTSTQKLIWMDSAGASEIMSANLDGTGQVTLHTPTGFARGISLDSQGRIFFSSNNTLRRIDANGSNPVTIYTDASTNPLGNPRVDATNGHVYVGADGVIKRMDLDGSNQKVIVRGLSQPRAIGLDLLHNHIYWLDADTISDYVGRARLDDTGFAVIADNSVNIVQSSGFTDLVVDPANGFIFYADELTAKIFRADLNGQNQIAIYTSPSGLAPSGLTLSTGEPAQPLQDCNGNSINDDIDIAAGAPDCDNNGVIDTCQIRPCPQRTFLLDQGDDAASTQGRAVGTTSQWQIFQPFDVPASGWTMSELAIDGYTINYADGSGLTVKLFPDNGTGTAPNETVAIASATLNWRFNTTQANWVYVSMPATLSQGRYWARIEANSPIIYQGSMNFGTSGLQSKSRSISGAFTNPASPVALRIVQAPVCYANCDNSTVAPILTANDFQCFLNKFAAQDPGANCDGSTTNPILTANDFQCFLNAYAAGCP